jgi:hypothetical protein
MPAALLAAAIATGAGAHHSFAPHFDSRKPVSIAGKVTKFDARNPHSYLHIQAVDENGRTQTYICESHGVTQLTRNGVTPAILKPGAQLRIQGSQSRNDPHRCFFTDVFLPDGRTLNVNGSGGATTAPARTARRDIFGTWLLAPAAGRSTSGPQPMMQSLTAAGKAAVAAYDPFRDDPTFRCSPVGVRRDFEPVVMGGLHHRTQLFIGEEWCLPALRQAEHAAGRGNFDEVRAVLIALSHDPAHFVRPVRDADGLRLKHFLQDVVVAVGAVAVTTGGCDGTGSVDAVASRDAASRMSIAPSRPT